MLITPSQLLAPRAAPDRTCGPCTVCCTVMPVTELKKQARYACTQATGAGCAIHPTRPQSCRDFHCLWLRGAIGHDEATRPDVLGVLFDSFMLRGESELRVVAHEVWEHALETPEARQLLDALTKTQPVGVSRRDGRWSVLG